MHSYTVCKQTFLAHLQHLEYLNTCYVATHNTHHMYNSSFTSLLVPFGTFLIFFYYNGTFH